MTEGRNDLLTYYRTYFEAGMVDLSSSSPPPVAQLSDNAHTVPVTWAYAEPGGPRELRAAIAARYGGLSVEDIVVTAGASEALAAVTLSLVRGGDCVSVAPGSYPTVPALAQSLGARVAWQEAPLAGAGMALTSNPGVPSGAPIEIKQWLADARDAGAVAVVDEVYRDLSLDGTRLPAAAELDPGAVSIGDLSKPLGLGGLRIGWAACRDRTLTEAIRNQTHLLSGGVAAPSAALALRAMEAFDASVAGVLQSARETADRTYAVLRRHGWLFQPARFGLTVLACPQRDCGEGQLAGLRSHGLFLLPATVFGMDAGFRVSLLHPEELDGALHLLAAPAAGRPDRLVVLTKAPLPGLAKTRLAESLGREAAARLAAAFVADTLALAAAGEWSTTVAYTPAGSEALLRLHTSDARFVLQAGGDLGCRIAAALEGELAGGGAVVLIGSDTPDLPPAVVTEAFAALRSADIVIGPAIDGGFYLLGARRFDRRLFEGVEWSSDSVFDRVAANAARLGLTLSVLSEWEDIDDAASLGWLKSRIACTGRAPATSAALRTLPVEVTDVR